MDLVPNQRHVAKPYGYAMEQNIPQMQIIKLHHVERRRRRPQLLLLLLLAVIKVVMVFVDFYLHTLYVSVSKCLIINTRLIA